MSETGLKSGDTKLYQPPESSYTNRDRFPRTGRARFGIEGERTHGSLLLTKPTSLALVEDVKTWSVARECGGRGRSWDASGEDVVVAARAPAWRGRKNRWLPSLNGEALPAWSLQGCPIGCPFQTSSEPQPTLIGSTKAQKGSPGLPDKTLSSQGKKFA